MKVKVTFSEEQMLDLIQTTIKNKFPHENIEFGKMTVNLQYNSYGPMDRDAQQGFKSIEVEVDFK